MSVFFHAGLRMDLQWWMWVVAGVVLLLAELAIPAFFILWFGLGALLVGLIVLILPAFSVTAQLALWTAASVAMVTLWFKYFRKGRQDIRSGTPTGDAIGEIGLLVQPVEPFGRGKVRFQKPLLGSDEWICLADGAIAAGERVRVVAVEGNFIKVAKA